MSFRQQESVFLTWKQRKQARIAKLQFRQMLFCFLAEHLPFFIKIIANAWLDGGCREAKLKSIGVINEATVIEVLKRNGQKCSKMWIKEAWLMEWRGLTMINGDKTHRATSACEYKISHLYITFTKIHFILKIFSVQLQCIPCDTQKKKATVLLPTKKTLL